MAKGTKTGGRVAGVPNKATQEAREAIGDFVRGNAHRLQQWLDAIADTDPEKAFSLFQSVIEYHVPKLARTELSMDQENPLTITITPSQDWLSNFLTLPSKEIIEHDASPYN